MASKKISQLPLNTSSLPTNAVIITNIGGVTYQSPLSTLGDPSPYKFYDANNYSIIPKIGNNSASGYNSNVAGGYDNSASGYCSSILGGSCNNTNNQSNTFILGSNITANAQDTTYVNNLFATNNIVIQGSLSAAGGATFANTVFTTTSALSVINLGVGPALYVYQTSGPYDVASFVDGDGIEVLHVGNANFGQNGKVGINQSFPNKELTVTGEISATGIIYALSGNSFNWNSVYNSVLSNSANNASINYANANYLPLSGGTITGNVTILSGLEVGSGNLILEINQNNVSVYGILSSNSAIYDFVGNSNQWNSVYTSWNSASSTSVVSYNDTRFSKLSSQAYTLVYPTNSIQPTNGSNTASGYYSNVAGGRSNTASGCYSNVASGYCNIASGNASSVVGGETNTASGDYSNIAGGYQNSASGKYSNVSGGGGNTVSGNYSNVAGGQRNTASGCYSNVAGGCCNTASGCYSSILGGGNNNTNSQCNTFILGSNITAPQPNYTYVNNLSSQNSINATIISSTSGNSNQWNSVYTNVNSISADWNSVYTNVNSASADWNSVYLNQTNFVHLSGGTMIGKLNLPASTTASAGINLGVGAIPTSPVVGDLIATNSRLYFQESPTSQRIIAYTNSANNFNNVQTIDANTSTTLLQVTQRGTGEALRVEDDTTPDSTAFIVGSGGNVGIGLSSLSGIDAKLTVVGNISATGVVYTSNGNSNLWNSVYTSWESASSTSVVSYNDTRFSKLSSQAYTLVYPTNSIKPTNGSNTASANYSNVAGGNFNTASGGKSNVAGGTANSASGYFSNIAGGRNNTASSYIANVAGGYVNTASGYGSNIGGGAFNTACGDRSNIAGGFCNIADGGFSNIAGGFCNISSGYESNVAGGICNTASGDRSNVAGGRANTASGCYSSVLGGKFNNTNSQCNTFILGSNITASQPNFTYVNNLSSKENINANVINSTNGNSDQWNSAYSNQINFLPLSGGSLTGKLILSSIPNAPLNIGSNVTPSPSLLDDGDFWLGTSHGLRYRSSNVTYGVASTNLINTFEQSQVISMQSSSTNVALRITQAGTGNALVVEDSTNPDSNPFIIDRNGTVGIGLSSLSGIDAKLTVVGNISATGIVYANNGNSDLWNYVYSNVNAASSNWNSAYTNFSNNSSDYIKQNGNSFNTRAIIGTIDNNDFSINTNNTEKMRIFSNGNVVYDDFSNLPGAAGNSTYKVMHYASPTNAGSTMLSMASKFSHTVFFGNLGGSTGGFVIGSEGTDKSISFKQGLTYSNSNTLGTGTTVMSIAGNGNVGIGTTTPNEKLTVVGNISATQNYFSGSNKSIFTPQTNTVGVSAISNIVAVSVLPATPDPSTLYIVI